MLADPQVQNLMREVAAGVFPAQQLLEVRSEPSFDEDGREALRITLVLTDEIAQALTGEQLTSLLVDVHHALLREGDERFPVIYYATPTDDGGEDDE